MGNVYAYRGRLTPALIADWRWWRSPSSPLGMVGRHRPSAQRDVRPDVRQLPHARARDSRLDEPTRPSACGTCHVNGTDDAAAADRVRDVPRAGVGAILGASRRTPANACGTHARLPRRAAGRRHHDDAAQGRADHRQGPQVGEGHRHRRSRRLSGGREGRLQGRAQGRHQVGQDEDRLGHREARRARSRGATRPPRRALTA